MKIIHRQTNTQAKWIIGLSLFIGIVGTYLMLIRLWGFDGEDYVLLYGNAQVNTMCDFAQLFVHGNVERLSRYVLYVPGDVTESTTFFSYYRPLFLAISCMLYKLFGMSAYSYFVFSIILHALITTFIFYGLSLLCSNSIACLAALFFAFHPTLEGWMCYVDLLQHYLALFFGILTLIVFYHWAMTAKKYYFVGMLFLFFLSILSREVFIALPIALLLVGISFSSKIQMDRRQFIFYMIGGFAFIFMLYGLLRGINNYSTMHLSTLFDGVFRGRANPLTVQILPGLQNLFLLFWHACKDIYHFFYDFFWLMLLPWCTYNFLKEHNLLLLYKIFKFMVLLLGSYLFITNSQKRLIIKTLFFGICLLWPLLLISNAPMRFFYEPLPFFIASLALLINFSKASHRVKSWGIACFVMLVIFNTSFTISGIGKKAHEKYKYTYNNICIRKYASALQNKPILVLNGTHLGQTFGTIHALQLYGVTGRVPHFYFRRLHFLPKTVSAKMFVIKNIDHGFRITSRDKNCAWLWLDPMPWPSDFIDEVKIHRQDERNNIFDVSLIFKNEFWHKETAIVIWSEAEQEFVVLLNNV